MRNWTLRHNTALHLTSLLLLVTSTQGQVDPLPPPTPAPTSDHSLAAEAKKAYQENLLRYKDNPDVLVLPGLLAHRKNHQVQIWASATSLAHSDPVEFFLIPPDSGKDYEALAVAYVKPSDVHRALEFVGMKPGRPVDFAANQFWPKGERVFVTFEWQQPGHPGITKVRAEELLINTRTAKTLPKTGLVFTGSFWIQPDDAHKKPLYAADVVDPRSIASNFNCRASILDVPRQAVQGDVYGSQKLNPTYRFTPGQRLQVLLQPEYTNGKLRVADLSLKAELGQKYVLKDAAGTQLNEGPTFVHVLAACNKLIEAGRDPFLTVTVDPIMTVQQVRELYALLMSVEAEQGIRIEAPPPNELFCRALFPRDQWRDRKNRLGRPWELHLETDRDSVLILPADEIDDNQGLGDLTFKVKTGEEAAQILAQKSDRFSMSLYLFVDPQTPYGQMMRFLRTPMKTHRSVFVFFK